MKKLLFVMSLVTLLAACGGSTEDTKANEEQKESPDMVIGEGKFGETKLG